MQNCFHCCLASHLLSCLFQKQQISQGDEMPQLMGLPPLNSHLSLDLGLANLHYLFNSLMPFRLILFLFCPTSDIVLSRRAGSSGIVCCYQMVGNRNTGSESGLCASAHLTWVLGAWVNQGAWASFAIWKRESYVARFFLFFKKQEMQAF